MKPEYIPAPAQAGSRTPAHDENKGGVIPVNDRESNDAGIGAPNIESLSNYREGVETLMRLQSNAPISNSIPAHAAILIEKFFEHSQDHVRIFCTRLSPEVFGNAFVVDQARRAVEKRDVCVSVITQTPPKPSAFLEFLRSGKPGVKLVVAHTPRVQQLPTNFAVMDGSAVRVETDREKCEATAVMNAPEVANSWVKYFDRMMLTEESKHPTGVEVTPA